MTARSMRVAVYGTIVRVVVGKTTETTTARLFQVYLCSDITKPLLRFPQRSSKLVKNSPSTPFGYNGSTLAAFKMVYFM